MINISDLPVNAPKVCPACGGPWTYGYIVKKMPGQPGSRAKKIYRWALECRNEGCGLGYFIGSEIGYEEIEGLKLIKRKYRPKEIPKMAEEKEEMTAGKRWAEKYDACIECGKTDQPHASGGLCRRCDGRKRYRDRATAVTKPPKAKKAPAKTPAAKGGNLVEVHITDAACKNIGFVVDLDALSPELRDEIKAKVADKLTDRLLAGLGGK